MENNVVTTDEKRLASTFNNNSINIVEMSTGKTQKNLSKMSHGKSKQEVLYDILNAYKTHPSIKQIEMKFDEQNFFEKKIFSLSLLLHQKLKTLLIVLIQIKPQE